MNSATLLVYVPNWIGNDYDGTSAVVLVYTWIPVQCKIKSPKPHPTRDLNIETITRQHGYRLKGLREYSSDLYKSSTPCFQSARISAVEIEDEVAEQALQATSGFKLN